jgi:Spy/CpxP family protein refolding chaperone
MNPLHHWKIILTMLAIFVAGTVTGSMVTVRVIKSVIEKRAAPDHWAAGMMREYQHRLELTPEQLPKVRAIVERAGGDLRKVRGTVGAEIAQVVRTAQEDVARELTPEQLVKFDDLRREQRQRFLERMTNGPQPPPKGKRPPGPFFGLPPEGKEGK